MRWNLQWILKQKNNCFDFDETLNFPSEMFHNLSQINGLSEIHVIGHGQYDQKSRQLYIEYQIDGEMILPCAISLEDVNYPFEISSSSTFAFYKPDFEEDVIEVKKDIVDLTPVIFQEIMLEVPMRVVKEDAVLQTKGKGWKVIDESDVDDSSDEEEIDPRLAVLKDYFKDKE